MVSQQDHYKLAGETGIHPRTVRRWVEGEKTDAATDYALRAAWAKMRLPGEPPPKVQSEVTQQATGG